MGQSSSTEQASPELREVQALAASTGALPALQRAFSVLADPNTNSISVNSLQKCFELTFENQLSEQTAVAKELPVVFSYLGSAIVDLFFLSDKNGVSWIEFLRGYVKCCGRMVASTSFNNLLRVFSVTFSKAGLPVNLHFESYEDDCKVSGLLLPSDVLLLLWICWILLSDSRKLKLSLQKCRGDCSFPDISHLVLSAVELCAEGGHELDYWNCNVSELDMQLSAAKIHLWALKTVPNLADCFVQFVHARLCHSAIHEEQLGASCSSAHENSPTAISNTNLLTAGRAWAISLSQRGSIFEEISKICFPINADEINDNLLYRSSLHGKGLNRFWSNVEGYNGPLLVLIAAYEGNSNTEKWIIGALTNQGLESKDMFYGTSGSLYALSPVFHVYFSSGKEKNFVYSHLHPSGRVYDARPKPVGIAFGGSTGNERIYMDEDFARITVRHHAVDKTYQHGNLFPNQGFLPLDASVFEVEVWGLGGKTAKDIQASYKKREEIFTEQRRKVDLKNFASWEDSPEKMMMDMISDPNAVRREDR